MIAFISAGLNPPSSFTKEELDFMTTSELIIVDTYTAPTYLKEFGDRELTFVGRDRLENFKWILETKGDVSIVIPGDSFSATTHFTIYKEAVSRGIEVKIFHNASIFPAAATRLGLQLYKIGPVVSLPRFRDYFRPLSPYEKIIENFKRNLHTVLLLDTEPPLELDEAIQELLWMESETGKGLFTPEREIAVVSCLGTLEEKIIYGKTAEVKNWTSGKTPFTIVVPAELHFQERESLELFRL